MNSNFIQIALMPLEESLLAAAKELEVFVQEETNEAYREMLINRIRDLIHADFNKLINILYRMDVSETKLENLLKENPDSDAGVIITDLIIERQAQKIMLRQNQSDFLKNDNIPEEEKW
jgi:hypothetical protein